MAMSPAGIATNSFAAIARGAPLRNKNKVFADEINIRKINLTDITTRFAM